LLGCTWLIMKTEGPLQQKMHDLARPLALVLLVVIGIVSLWTPIAYPQIADRWFSMPNLIWFMPVPLLVLVTFYGLLKAVARHAHY
ncbi:cytochrome d ubiquinol oxidase subunit II, partial [Pseudomonas sp. MOB-449]|nr:cytochrome d ubiquinol oxidase subunit II [Pseudomonas sp. MOB-449]